METEAMEAAELESSLVRQAQRGDTSAFNRIVLTYQQIAYSVALRMLGDPEAAADATQDAFLSAYRHIQQFQEGSLKAWLLRIVTNSSLDALRRQKRRPGVSLDALRDDEERPFDPPDATDLPESVVLRGEAIATLEAGILELPPDQRAVVLLCDVHGLGYDEAAAAIRVPVGTVKSRLSRGRARLRDYVLRHPELFQRP